MEVQWVASDSSQMEEPPANHLSEPVFLLRFWSSKMSTQLSESCLKLDESWMRGGMACWEMVEVRRLSGSAWSRVSEYGALVEIPLIYLSESPSVKDSIFKFLLKVFIDIDATHLHSPVWRQSLSLQR